MQMIQYWLPEHVSQMKILYWSHNQPGLPFCFSYNISEEIDLFFPYISHIQHGKQLLRCVVWELEVEFKIELQLRQRMSQC